jgi:heavy metal sensor kinase
LTFSHAVFFALLLAAIGFGFRESLRAQAEEEVRQTVEDAWNGAKAFLQVSNGLLQWREYPDDPEMQAAQLRLRAMHLLLDSDGVVLSISGPYTSLPAPTAGELRRVIESGQAETFILRSAAGTPYMIRAGRITGVVLGRYYYFAIGRPLEPVAATVATFTRNYFVTMPFLLAFTSLLGWWVAGSVLKPLNDVARAADKITGSNLSLRIPLRGAGDELDHMIANFNQMTERLHEAFDQVRRFSTDVSHELRTPLTAIRGQLEVALLTAKTPGQYHEAILGALEDVEHLTRLVSTLLQLAQAESGKLVLERVRLDLAEVVEGMVDQFKPLAEEKHLSLTSSAGPGLAILGDRMQLERLLGNLLSNALKYTQDGGHVKISAFSEPQKGRLCLQVEDDGIGISAEDLPHIFDRFFRVRAPRGGADQGLGLGLSFVALIAKAHGGHAEVTSTRGQGSCFRVYLPAAGAEAPRSSSPALADSVH